MKVSEWHVTFQAEIKYFHSSESDVKMLLLNGTRGFRITWMTYDLKFENMLNVCMSKSYFPDDSHCLKNLCSELSIKIIMPPNHNSYFNKSLKSDWLSTILISALIGQCIMTVHVVPK